VAICSRTPVGSFCSTGEPMGTVFLSFLSPPVSYIIRNFGKPIALLVTFTLVPCLAYYSTLKMEDRSHWPSSLRHELSSLAGTLGSWVRIPLKAWMSVCVYSVFVLGSGLSTGWSPVQGVLPTVLGLRNWSETTGKREDGGDMFFWNVGWPSADYTALYSRR
jgi:hypothetical protein